MAEDDQERQQSRAFWRGTFSFGLVSVPVELHAAVRSRRTSLRMLGPQGQPLSRRYYCSLDDEPLSDEDIVRGYSFGDDEYVLVSDEELKNLEPERSRDIDLRRFVSRDEIDRRLLERPYVLAPSGDSTKAYHLLAETMERSRRAGIATFVMHGREYVIAVFAEGGLLQGATLRFADELRSPRDIGLPQVPDKVPSKRVKAFAAALEGLAADRLDESLLGDGDEAQLRALADEKREAGRDVIEVEGDDAAGASSDDNVVDIMALLKKRMGAKETGEGNARRRKPSERKTATSAAKTAKQSAPASRNGKRRDQQKSRRETPHEQTKEDLYEHAQALDIPGRSKMSKRQLRAAIDKHG